MQPSSILCRTQEALHRERAASSSLANVRDVANKAASAWSHEATLAEHRERRQERTRVTASTLLEEKQLRSLGEEAANENPDRGYPAGAGTWREAGHGAAHD